MEALQKISDPKLVDCPACEAPALRKQVTAAAFKLKGTGWYETDFKNSGKAPSKQAKSTDTATADKAAAPADSSKSSGASA